MKTQIFEIKIGAARVEGEKIALLDVFMEIRSRAFQAALIFQFFTEVLL